MNISCRLDKFHVFLLTKSEAPNEVMPPLFIPVSFTSSFDRGMTEHPGYSSLTAKLASSGAISSGIQEALTS